MRRATPTQRSETLESLLSVAASIHRYSDGGANHPSAVPIKEGIDRQTGGGPGGGHGVGGGTVGIEITS